MARGTVMTDEAMQINKDVIVANIRKDFLTKDVSYQDIGTIQCLAGYKVKAADAMVRVRNVLKNDFNAGMLPVGNNKVAVVKRP